MFGRKTDMSRKSPVPGAGRFSSDWGFHLITLIPGGYFLQEGLYYYPIFRICLTRIRTLRQRKYFIIQMVIKPGDISLMMKTGRGNYLWLLSFTNGGA